MINSKKNNTLLFGKIQDFLNKREVNNYDVKDLFTRAQIVPTGQIQIRSTITANSHNVGTEIARPMPQQRPANLIEELGVKFIDGLSSNFNYPKINGTQSQWVSQNEEGSVSNTTFDSVKLSPRRLLTYVEYSNEVVLNPNADVAGAIEEDLINSIWEKVQGTMFNDVFDVTNATTIADFDDIVAFELAASQQKINNAIYLVSPTAASKLKKMKNGDTPIYQNGMINGYMVKETPSLEGEKIIFGDFSKLLLGQFGAMDVLCDDVTAQNRGVIRLIANNYFDWGLIDDNAFAFASTETASGEDDNNTEPED